MFSKCVTIKLIMMKWRKKAKKKLEPVNPDVLFCKRECNQFIPSVKDQYKCGCGASLNFHIVSNISVLRKSSLPKEQSPIKWFSNKNTKTSPTDAHGAIEFHYSGSTRKAQFIRVAHDSKPELIFDFLLQNWSLILPKVIISVHGGLKQFSLKPKLKAAFNRGLLQTVKRTSAWIITSGINQGAARHVGEALNDVRFSTINDIIAIGISPWGNVEMREQLNGKNHIVNFSSAASYNKSCFSLESHHTHFLLADNGTVGKFGADVILRKKLEKYISGKIITKLRYQTVPIVGLILGGGPFIFLTVLDYIYENPPVPVIVVEGSGKAADLISFAYKCTDEDGSLMEDAYEELFLAIQSEFKCSTSRTEEIMQLLLECVKKKELITVFTLSEPEVNEIDTAIFTALFRGKKQSPYDQLMWTLTWNRVDIAQTQVFKETIKWTNEILYHAMLEALSSDKVEFVKLLLDQGVDMQAFLTISRLECLYNIKENTNNIFYNLIYGSGIQGRLQRKISLTDVGAVIERLIGGTFRSIYRLKTFRSHYQTLMGNLNAGNNENINMALSQDDKFQGCDKFGIFRWPFSELLLWAVLMNRQQMALFLWQHGEEAMAKALMAYKLNCAMAEETSEEDLDTHEDFINNSKEFADLAVNLLKECYKQDELYSQQLLVYRLPRWSEETCLSLAVANKHLEFVAHNCCQSIISQMWLGNLHIRQHRNIKIILGILFPLAILLLDFKEPENNSNNKKSQYIPDVRITITCDNKNQQSKNGFINQGFVLQESNDMIRIQRKSGRHKKPSDYSSNIQTMSHSIYRIFKTLSYFYKAPITKFWFHSMSYFVFVLLYCYVLLSKFDFNTPTTSEWLVIGYIYTIALERTRDLLLAEASTFRKKFIKWMERVWNIGDTIAIFMFTIGVILRFYKGLFLIGRWIYCLNIIFWIIRLMDICSFHMYLGPYVMTIKRMIKDVAYFAIILLIMILAFGVSKQAILNPDKDFNWLIVEHVLYQPYFIIYGELFVDNINPGCDIGKETCTTGAWVTPILMAVYLLMTYMLLVNLLIAKFNHTFASVQHIAVKIWKFQRYNLVMKHFNGSILPPPFTLINHLYELLHLFYCLIRRKKVMWYSTFKQDLTQDYVEKLQSFEEHCLKIFLEDYQNQEDDVKRLHNICQRTEEIENSLQEEYKKLDEIILSNQTLELQMEKFQELTTGTQNALNSLIRMLASQSQDDGENRRQTVSRKSSASSVPNFPLSPMSSPECRRRRHSSTNSKEIITTFNDKFLTIPQHESNQIKCENASQDITSDVGNSDSETSVISQHSYKPTFDRNIPVDGEVSSINVNQFESPLDVELNHKSQLFPPRIASRRVSVPQVFNGVMPKYITKISTRRKSLFVPTTIEAVNNARQTRRLSFLFNNSVSHNKDNAGPSYEVEEPAKQLGHDLIQIHVSEHD